MNEERYKLNELKGDWKKAKGQNNSLRFKIYIEFDKGLRALVDTKNKYVFMISDIKTRPVTVIYNATSAINRLNEYEVI